MFNNSSNSFNRMFQPKLNERSKSMDYLNPVVYLAESNTELNFSTDLLSDFSIMNLLDYCGFSPSNMGYKYIFKILSVCVSQMHVPIMVKDFHEIAAHHFNTRINNVECSVKVAIKDAAKHNKLMNLNKIFNCDYVDEYITNGDFFNFVLNRLIAIKKHNEIYKYIG